MANPMAGKHTLIRRLVAGDDAAIGELYECYTRAILNFARSLDPHLDDDRLNGIALRVVALLKRHRGEFDEGFRRKFTAWLYRVVRNVIFNEKRAHCRRPVHLSLDALGDTRRGRSLEAAGHLLTPAARALKEEMRRVVDQRIDRLPVMYRAIVRLYWHEELTTTQIAQRLGLNVEVVRKRLDRAHERLRADLAHMMTTLQRAWEARSHECS